MKHAAKIRKLYEALGDLCNDTISESDGQWLQESLLNDVEVQRTYIDYMAMHANLHAECAALHVSDADADSESCELSLPDVFSLDLPNSAQVQLSDARGNTNESLAASRTSRFLVPTKRWSLAVALAGIALFSSLLTYSLVSSWNPNANVVAGSGSATDSNLPAVARITGTQNCLWKNDAHPIGYGSNLVPGQELELLEGIAEITFEDGATVLVESPASFSVQLPHVVDLKSGRMAAVVPKESRGFLVQTPSLSVHDVGTEYGLVARESGASELHVFNGIIKAEVVDSSGKTYSQLELNASQAARVNPVATTISEFPANRAAFVRSMVPSSGPQDGLFAYDGFDYPDGPLSAQNGGFGWAGPWFDIEADVDAGPHTNGVAPGSLTVEGIVPQGNRACQRGQNNRIRRSLGTAVGAVFDAAGLVENQDGVRLVGRDGREVYISFLQRVSKVNDDFYGFELHRGDGNRNRVLCIGSGVEGAGYGVTSNVNVYGPRNFPALGEEDTEVNFFVVKISFGLSNRDIVEIYRNPESLRDESACTVDAVLKGNFAFDRISMGNFYGENVLPGESGEKTHEIDELRVGTHFLSVTGRWGGDRGGRTLRRITFQPSGETSKPGQFGFSSLIGSALSPMAF